MRVDTRKSPPAARERPPTVLCWVCGAFVLFIGGVIINFSPYQEIPIWYGVTLCPVHNDSDSFVSQRIDPAGACPYGLTTRETEPETFILQSTHFRMGKSYRPLVYRTDDSELRMTMTIYDGNTLVWSRRLDTAAPWPESGSETVGRKVDSQKELAAMHEARRRFPERRILNDEEDRIVGMPYQPAPRERDVPGVVQPASRKLLKGGSFGSSSHSSGGNPYREHKFRRGVWARQGGIFSYNDSVETPYGLTNPGNVAKDQYVNVHRIGPRFGLRGGMLSDPGIYYGGTEQDCVSAHTGCEYRLGTSLTRDELFGDMFEPIEPRDQIFLLIIEVHDMTLKHMPAVPLLFVSFYTEDGQWIARIGWWIGQLGFLMLGICWPVLALIACIMCPEPRRENSSGEYSGRPSEQLPRMLNAPLPESLGPRGCVLDLSDQDYRSTDVPAPDRSIVAYLNLWNNDITRVAGLVGFPNLVRLQLRNNDLRSLSGIAEARRLRWLDVSSNDLTSLDEVERLYELEYLSADNNDVVGQLKIVSKSLIWLSVADNDLRGFTGLTTPKLRYLNAFHNDIITMRGLSDQKALEEVNLRSNYLTAPAEVYALLDTLTHLHTIDVQNNYTDDQATGLRNGLADRGVRVIV